MTFNALLVEKTGEAKVSAAVQSLGVQPENGQTTDVSNSDSCFNIRKHK